MSDPPLHSNSFMKKPNLPESSNLASTPGSSGFSPFGTVQLPPVYSYRQSQQIPQQVNAYSPPPPLQQQHQQQQPQPRSQLESSAGLSNGSTANSNTHIAQPLQPHLHPQLQPQPQPQSQQPNQSQSPEAYRTNDHNPKPRMRVSKACDRCRTHKIKCSGTTPCATCVRQKKECTFSSALAGHSGRSANSPGYYGVDGNGSGGTNGAGGELYKRQKLMINTEPFGLPTVERSNDREYIAHLENRVQYLEGILSGSTNETFRQPISEEPDNELITKTLFSASSKWRFSRRHQNLLIVELCQSMYANLSDELKEKVTIPRRQYFGWNMSGVNYLDPEALPAIPDLDNDLDKEHLINFFFKEINPLFAIIHEAVFREQYAAYTKIVKEELLLDEFDSKTNQTKLFVAILYLIYALSIRFIEFQKPKNSDIDMLKLEEKLFKYAHKIVSILSFEWESFELVQSWVLITLYLRITHRQTSCWHALGNAINMTKSMGLGFDVENSQIRVSTAYEKLKAKRIFWCVFTFDRVFGLQVGRYCGVRDEDFTRAYPSFDFALETEKDDWLTLPALAMIHVARVSNFVHTAPTDNPHLIKYQQVNAELVKLHDWFNRHGFRNDLFFNRSEGMGGAPTASAPESTNEISSLVKAQVKLHYYDLVLCIHGKILFNYIGRKIASHGLKVDLVLDACNGVVEVLDKVNKAGLLYCPWYSTLLLLFNIGVSAITLVNGGVYVVQSRTILKNAIKFLTLLRKSPIRNENNKLVFRERFKMVRECTWALKMANKILSLRLEEDIKALGNIGVDHGSDEVNQQYFTQLGRTGPSTTTNGAATAGGAGGATATTTTSSSSFGGKTQIVNGMFEGHVHRGENTQMEQDKASTGTKNGDKTYISHVAQQHRFPNENDGTNNSIRSGAEATGAGATLGTGPTSSIDNPMSTPGSSSDFNDFNTVDAYSSADIDNMLGNIQWFDQWLNFNNNL